MTTAYTSAFESLKISCNSSEKTCVWATIPSNREKKNILSNREKKKKTTEKKTKTKCTRTHQDIIKQILSNIHCILV